MTSPGLIPALAPRRARLDLGDERALGLVEAERLARVARRPAGSRRRACRARRARSRAAAGARPSARRSGWRSRCPAPPGMIAVLMPTTSPLQVEERPAAVARVDGGVGLDEVVVRARRRCSRPFALTMPIVTVWPRPNGLPIATTYSPTRSCSLEPSGDERADPSRPSSSSTREVELARRGRCTFASSSRSSASLTRTVVGVLDDVRVGRRRTRRRRR